MAFDLAHLSKARIVYFVFDCLVLGGDSPEVAQILGMDDEGKPVPPGQLGHLPLRIRRAIARRLCARAPHAGKVNARVQFVPSMEFADPDAEAQARRDGLHKRRAAPDPRRGARRGRAPGTTRAWWSRAARGWS